MCLPTLVQMVEDYQFQEKRKGKMSPTRKRKHNILDCVMKPQHPTTALWLNQLSLGITCALPKAQNPCYQESLKVPKDQHICTPRSSWLPRQDLSLTSWPHGFSSLPACCLPLSLGFLVKCEELSTAEPSWAPMHMQRWNAVEFTPTG